MAKDLMDNKVLDDEQLSTVAGGTAVEMQQCRISSRTK